MGRWMLLVSWAEIFHLMQLNKMLAASRRGRRKLSLLDVE
jgi:hypothetical protein